MATSDSRFSWASYSNIYIYIYICYLYASRKTELTTTRVHRGSREEGGGWVRSYLSELLLELHGALHDGTTDRVLHPLHVGVHVVQSEHLASARHPVLLRHCFFSSCSLYHKSDFPPMLLTGPVSGKRKTHGGVKKMHPALTECKLIMFISSYQLFYRNNGIGGKHSPHSASQPRVTLKRLAVDIPSDRRHAHSARSARSGPWLAGLGFFWERKWRIYVLSEKKQSVILFIFIFQLT